MERSQALELGVLLVATVYAIALPFKGTLSLVDAAILLALFAAYTWATSRAPAEEPELVGPAASIGALPSTQRRLATVALFVVAGFMILVSAEPFAESLVASGRSYNIDEFLLVQWVAPLASETPEFIVAMLWVWRGQSAAAMRALVSSKVNQWTLLIATLPIAFSAGSGHLGGMPITPRQQHELWLTAAQSLFAIVLIAKFEMSHRAAFALLIPFVIQVALPLEIRGIDVRMAFAIGYAGAAVLLLLDPERRAAIARWPRYVRESLVGSPSEQRDVARTGPPADAEHRR